jgi:serine/threonine protein kinase
VSDERYQRLCDLAYRASLLPESERDAFLEEECPDAAMRDEVRELLRYIRSDESPPPVFEPPRDPPRVMAPGQRIGSYEVVREIGRGGMGVVYLANDVALNSPVALKVMHGETAWDEDQRARFLREAQIVRSLSHPGIVTVFQFHEFDGLLCIASEYIDGINLRTRLAAGPLSVQEAVRIATRIAEVLASAGTRGIVHRDLKPENVMIGSDGRVKVLDFGLAKNVDVVSSGANHPWSTGVTRPGVVVGTPAYMAPEQLKGASLDPRTDLFALGTMLYELVSGIHPFETGDATDTAARILIHEPKSLAAIARVPARFESIVRKCLAKQPSDRYQSASELLPDLEKAATSRPGEPTAPTAPVQQRHWWRIHQFALTVVYAIIAIAAWRATANGLLGSPLIFAAAACAAAAGGSARMHLLFVERTQPPRLSDEVARIGVFIRVADWLFTLLFAASTTLLIGAHQLVAATVAAFAIMFAYGFLVIEPATTRKAFSRRSSGVRARKNPVARRGSSSVGLGLLVLVWATVCLAAAELHPATLQAFERYVRLTEARIDSERGERFLWLDRLAANRRTEIVRQLARGEVIVEKLETKDRGRDIDVPSGMVHHWVSDAFIPGATLAQTVAFAQDYDHHAELFQPAVARSRLLARNGNTFRVVFRFVQKRIITVVTDVESEARFAGLDASRTEARVYATRISEIEDAFSPTERILPPGEGHGYLWRMNTYCRFVQRDGGVYVEFESLSLSRDLPLGIGWMVRPFVTSVPRDSLVFTLQTYINKLGRRV